jgi:hypothetical protein
MWFVTKTKGIIIFLGSKLASKGYNNIRGGLKRLWVITNCNIPILFNGRKLNKVNFSNLIGN